MIDGGRGCAVGAGRTGSDGARGLASFEGDDTPHILKTRRSPNELLGATFGIARGFEKIIRVHERTSVWERVERRR